MKCGVVGQPCKTPHFHPRHRHPPSWNDPPKNSVRFNRLRTGVERFRSCLHKWYGLLCGLCVAWKNWPTTMLSSNVQSIELPMDCPAWRFWATRQSNGCSTPAPRFSAAQQWTVTTRSNEENHVFLWWNKIRWASEWCINSDSTAMTVSVNRRLITSHIVVDWMIFSFANESIRK